MNIDFPYKITDYKRALGQSNSVGVFPIGIHNTWHGGLHIEDEKEIKAIADGRIIAYRFNNKYIEEAIDGKKIPYSNGFILMQHDHVVKRPLPLKGGDFKFTFYSLYHHLMSKTEMEMKNKVPDLYNKKTFIVTAKNHIRGLKAHGNKKYYDEVKVIIPKGHSVKIDSSISEEEKSKAHWTKVGSGKNYKKISYTDPVTKKTYNNLYVYKGEINITDKTATIKTESNIDKKSEKGARIYSKPNGAFLKIIKTNEAVEIDSTSLKSGWYKLKKEEAYIKKSDVTIKSSFKDDVKIDEVDNCELVVKAGTTIGHSGKYGASKQEKYIACHLEIFSEDDPTELLKGTYQTENKNTHFKIAQGASLQTNIIDSISIAKDTPIKIIEINEDFCQIEVSKLVATSSRDYLTNYQASDNKSYDILDAHFDTVNTAFGGKLKKGKKLYLVEELKDKNRKLKYKFPNTGKKFWVKTGTVKQTVEQIVETPITTKNSTSVLETTPKTTQTIEVTPTKGSEVNLRNAISEYYLVKPNKENTTATTNEEVILSINNLKKVKDNSDKYWYYVDTKNALSPQKGWIKGDNTSITKISAFDWLAFGFEAIDAGNDYVYSVQDILDANETNPFINKIWKIVDANKDKQISAQEWMNAYKRIEVVEKFSKLVCKHPNEWAYNADTICNEVEQFFDIGINLEEREKEKQELLDRKQKHMDALRLRVDNLCFWNDIKTGDVTTKKERKKLFLDTKPKSKDTSFSFLPEELRLKTDEEKSWDKEFEALEELRIKRKFPFSNAVHHFHPIAFVEHMKWITSKSYKKGDKGKNHGKILQEINIRLAGFGGNVPDEDFTERTEKSVVQFQKDYMKIEPNGIVDDATLKAIDEFSEKYTFTFEQIKCKCKTKGKVDKNVKTGLQELNKCNGFGDHSSKGKNYYERPGVHRSVLFGLKALLFYFEKDKSPYTLNKISSGYRCRFHPEFKKWKTTNHLGRALDLHFDKNGKRTREVVDTELIRKNYFVKYMNAPETDGGQTHGFGWKKNHFGLEPKIQNNGRSGATSWVHVDIREFESKYQNDNFFIKNEKDLLSEKIINLI